MYAQAVFALVIAWWILKGIDAGVQQAKTEVRRFREEYKVFRKEVRETVDKGTRAGRSVLGASRAAWRAMKGAPRGAGDFARKTAAGTGPAGRVYRAARAGGRLGAAAARAARHARASAQGSGQPRARGRFRRPRIGVCGGCGLPALLSALTRLADGRRLCRQCTADAARPSAASPPPAALGARPAGTAPAQAIEPAAPQAAPRPGEPAAQPEPAPRPAVPVPATEPAAQPVPQAPPAPSLPAPQPRNGVPVPRFIEPAAAVPAVPAAAPRPLQASPAGAPAPGNRTPITNGEPMTTPGNLPAVPGRSPVPRPGGTNGGEAGNHGQFLATAAGLRADAAVIKEQQSAMLANLYSVNGRDQVRDITEWAEQARAYAEAVAGMVNTVDPPEQRLIGAIAGAGGVENIPDMPYFGA